MSQAGAGELLGNVEAGARATDEARGGSARDSTTVHMSLHRTRGLSGIENQCGSGARPQEPCPMALHHQESPLPHVRTGNTEGAGDPLVQWNGAVLRSQRIEDLLSQPSSNAEGSLWGATNRPSGLQRARTSPGRRSEPTARCADV